jgi:hypothetical protein
MWKYKMLNLIKRQKLNLWKRQKLNLSICENVNLLKRWISGQIKNGNLFSTRKRFPTPTSHPKGAAEHEGRQVGGQKRWWRFIYHVVRQLLNIFALTFFVLAKKFHQFKNQKVENTKCQNVKSWICQKRQKLKIWICENVKMSKCEFVKMWI